MSRAESPAARLATEKNFTRAVLVLYLNLFVQWFVVTGARAVWWRGVRVVRPMAPTAVGACVVVVAGMESWSVPYAVDTFGWSDLETSLLYMGIGAANLCLLAWCARAALPRAWRTVCPPVSCGRSLRCAGTRIFRSALALCPSFTLASSSWPSGA